MREGTDVPKENSLTCPLCTVFVPRHQGCPVTGRCSHEEADWNCCPLLHGSSGQGVAAPCPYPHARHPCCPPSPLVLTALSSLLPPPSYSYTPPPCTALLPRTFNSFPKLHSLLPCLLAPESRKHAMTRPHDSSYPFRSRVSSPAPRSTGNIFISVTRSSWQTPR